jgi:hypothetical protein
LRIKPVRISRSSGALVGICIMTVTAADGG